MGNKNFSRFSINKTVTELGNVSRTVVSENFRGYAFKIYVENNFDFETAVKLISGNDDQEGKERVSSKLQIFLRNVEKDISGLNDRDFNFVETSLNSKCKSLPQKFHVYLDEVIKKIMNTK